jgi:hypothetical protein
MNDEWIIGHVKMRKGREESNRALKYVLWILVQPKENDGDSQVVKKQQRKGR